MNTCEEWLDKVVYFGSHLKSTLSQSRFALGLWFANHLITHDKSLFLSEIKSKFEKHNLDVFTLNAFPYGNFHQKEVKTQVYLPNWSDVSRKEYTLNCAKALVFLSEHSFVTVSTLPLGYKRGWNLEKQQQAVNLILDLILDLEKLEQQTKKRVQVCLEPEPGCVLEYSLEVVEFWEEWLLPNAKKKGVPINIVSRYLGICYDTCHQAVQFESPEKSLQLLAEHQISIGKMQLSNALEFKPDPKQLSSKFRQQFIEPKFLHQTVIQKPNQNYFFEDLQEAYYLPLAYWSYFWRVHYHIPLFSQELVTSEFLNTTVKFMKQSLNFALNHNLCSHFEIETYTWEILPFQWRPDNDGSLVKGIAKEFDFVRNCVSN